MNTVIVADSTALGIMETRPEPAWRVKLQSMRNKDLLAPDYGSMHVAAGLRARGHEFSVVNPVAGVHRDASAFIEPETDPEAVSRSEIGKKQAAIESRACLFGELERRDPRVILFPLSIYNLALYTRGLLGEIRKAFPGTVIVTGGIYATLHADELLEEGNADVVVRGEGELTTALVLDAVSSGSTLDDIAGISFTRNGNRVHNPPAATIEDLDSWPHLYSVSEEFLVKQRHDLLLELNPFEDYIPGSGFLTSRGCPEACSFCLDPAINRRRTRFHSPEYVRQVLAYCSENFPGGPGSFFFGDATFTMKRSRLYRILDMVSDFNYSYQIQTRADHLDQEIVDRLAGSGFTTVAIGAESFNSEVLRGVTAKGLDVEDVLNAALAVKQAGMHPALTFIAGLPGESRESIWRTVDILVENKLLTSTFFPLVVFRGTALFNTFAQMVAPAQRDALRLNQFSEEYLFVGDEFATREELTGFTSEVNRAIMDARLAG